MITKLHRILWVAAIAFVAGRAAAGPLPPPLTLPSLDGVSPATTLPNSVNGSSGLVRKSGGQATSVTLTNTGNTIDIASTSKRFVIDWTSFNIGQGYRVNFVMPDRASIGVNRVTGVGANYRSNIRGDLWSNGNVWLLNPNGILFSSTARVDVAGLLATPANFRNLDEFITSATGIPPNEVPDLSNAPPIRFEMPQVPGGVRVDNGAEIMLRGGPAMFIVGSAATGRNLQIAGTVTSDPSVLTRGLITIPTIPYGSTNTDTLSSAYDEVEGKSTQILYAASGDFLLRLKDRPPESSPPNLLSSNDLDLFDYRAELGFLGKAQVSDTVADDVIQVGETARTVAGQIVVSATAAYGVQRSDWGPGPTCDPVFLTCSVSANVYYFEPSAYFPVTQHPRYDSSSGTLGRDPSNTVGCNGPTTCTYPTLYYRSDSQVLAEYYQNESDPSRRCDDCAPGIRIRSSLVALDDGSSANGFREDGFDASLLISGRGRFSGFGGVPEETYLNVLTTPTANFYTGRQYPSGFSFLPVDVIFDASQTPVTTDPNFFNGGIPYKILLSSPGNIEVFGRDVIATHEYCTSVVECFLPANASNLTASNALATLTAPAVNLRVSASRFDSQISAERYLQLDEVYLDKAPIEVAKRFVPNVDGVLLLRNQIIDPQAGIISAGFDLAGGPMPNGKAIIAGGSLITVTASEINAGGGGLDVYSEGTFNVGEDVISNFGDIYSYGPVTISAIKGIYVGDVIVGDSFNGWDKAELWSKSYVRVDAVQASTVDIQAGTNKGMPGNSFHDEQIWDSLGIQAGNITAFTGDLILKGRDYVQHADLSTSKTLSLESNAAIIINPSQISNPESGANPNSPAGIEITSYKGGVCVGSGSAIGGQIDSCTPQALQAQDLIVKGYLDVRVGDVTAGLPGARKGIELRSVLGSVFAGDLTAESVTLTTGRSFDDGFVPGTVGTIQDIEVGDVIAPRLFIAADDAVRTDDLTVSGFLYIYSLNDLTFDPVRLKTLPSRLTLTSGGSRLCVGTRPGSDCLATSLIAPDSIIELFANTDLAVKDVQAGSSLRLRAAYGNLAARDLTADSIDVKAGATSAGLYLQDPNSSYSLNVRNVTANNGVVSIIGRDGITTGAITQQRENRASPEDTYVDLRSRTGTIATGSVVSNGVDPLLGGIIRIETNTGNLVSLSSISGKKIDILAPSGRIDVGTTNNSTFSGGAVTSRAGAVTAVSANGIRTGNIAAAGGYAELEATTGSISIGNVETSGFKSGAGECENKGVCVRAGTEAGTTAAARVDVGSVTAGGGDILLGGRTGVKTTST
ncbi:MAG: filamentous hemagglutinin N-terminal domain-containing protein, partial [Sinobacteraceae bacterium]|nr:filamentous hemagglutinin N-terminal domain-containing protein [Nevskiaceae bacterium]